MKKLLILFIAMLLCCLAMTALAEDEHQHEWIWEHNNQECWQVCKICRQEENRGGHHAYSCTGYPVDKCYYCGATEAEGAVIMQYSHAYDASEWYADETMHFRRCVFCSEYIQGQAHADTCMYPGVCNQCGVQASDGYIMGSTEHIKLHGLNFEYDQTTHWRVCAYCAETFDYGEHTCVCTNPGVCVECGVKAADGYIFDEIDHSYDLDRIEHDKTHHWYVCEDCGAETEHCTHWASCTDPGTCSVCGVKAAAGYILEGIMHDDYLDYDLTHHWYVCRDCREKTTDLFTHTASCTNPGVCDICGVKAADGYVLDGICHYGVNDEWLHDEEAHWMFCADCGEKIYLYAHEFNRENVCEVCGYQKTEQPAEGRYSLAHVTYDGQTISGKLTLSGGAALTPRTQIRVTFYLEGNIYMGTYCELDENGEFSAEGVGLIRYITVLALEEDSETMKRLDAVELYI